MVELDGETVLRSKPVIGYLHTGMEKTGRGADVPPGRHQRHPDGLPVAVLQRAGLLPSASSSCSAIEIPPRATWIRMLMCELNRISSHFLWLATNGSDIGAINMLVYGWREREMVLAFFEKVTGLRMNHNYFRPGGVAADLPDGWRDDVLALCEAIPKRMDEYDNLLTGQPILQNRLQGVGPLDADTAIGLGVTGPLLRSTGRGVGPAPRPALPGLRRGRLRRDRRDRGRLLGPLRHPVQRDPRVGQDRPPDRRPDAGRRLPDPGQEGHAAAAQPHRRVDGSPDPPLQAVHRGLPGPARRGLRAGREPPRRERLLHRLRRDGPALPDAHAGGQLRQPAGHGPAWPGARCIADAIAIVSTIDPVLGDVDR